MPRSPKYRLMVEASKAEMLLAVDLWNGRGASGPAAFVVHAQIAWRLLCHAKFEQDGTDYWYRRNGRRFRVNGDFRAWELSRSLRELYPDDDPLRRNIEFFIGIRDMVEHRLARDVATVISGKVQALILNYEGALRGWFDDSLADDLRFPIFLSTLSDDAGEAVAHVWARLPNHLTSYINGYDESLDREVASDQRYEFRVYLIPQVGPRRSPVWMEFLRSDDLTDEQREELARVVTVIRDRQVPVRNLGQLRASDVATSVETMLGARFRATPHHVRAWRHFRVRPDANADRPELTDERYCVYDEAHRDYLYTNAWVQKLVNELADPRRFEEVTGRPWIEI
ncbi:MAG: DUF3644 domain-containing protein [Chloroflexi bacterium]|nr:DUF3644 domain-containing protein [Chloroflexota bacterium]